jgi:prepilin-type N-terminal cleavage/methylation domain-containing protein
MRVFMVRKKINNLGFTLIELMISIAIFAILSSMVLVNFRANDKVHNLKNQAMLVLDGIKTAQTSALSGRLVDNSLPDSYGFLLSSGNFDFSGNVLQDCSAGCLYASTTDGWEFLNKINISDKVEIASYYKNKDGGIILNQDKTIIDFSPPRANMGIGLGNGDTPTDVFLEISDTSDSGIGFYCLGIDKMSGRMDFEARANSGDTCPSTN